MKKEEALARKEVQDGENDAEKDVSFFQIMRSQGST